MIQSQARSVLADLRADIARNGYECSAKHHLAVLFGDLRHLYSNTHRSAEFNAAKYKSVCVLEKKWQEDRVNPTGGADTIGEILIKVEQYIADLPAEVISNVITIPSQAEIEADRVLAILKQRGVTVSA